MKFYNRETELKILQQTKIQSRDRSRMTIITGRRRIGKTRLITESLREDVYLYFFVARKAENLLCQEFVEQITNFGIPVCGSISQFKDVFMLLMNEAACCLLLQKNQWWSCTPPWIYCLVQQTYRMSHFIPAVRSGFCLIHDGLS